jgi:hypothetical protein
MLLLMSMKFGEIDDEKHYPMNDVVDKYQLQFQIVADRPMPVFHFLIVPMCQMNDLIQDVVDDDLWIKMD